MHLLAELYSPNSFRIILPHVSCKLQFVLQCKISSNIPSKCTCYVIHANAHIDIAYMVRNNPKFLPIPQGCSLPRWFAWAFCLRTLTPFHPHFLHSLQLFFASASQVPIAEMNESAHKKRLWFPPVTNPHHLVYRRCIIHVYMIHNSNIWKCGIRTPRTIIEHL